ncbi:hypothetical protein ACSNOI_15115 [Actinomadura kijaniata]|uniref:hypothetical protein n=1 Tax=Actinomadura kijaniata TaxID=46161 RepID=UPI003F1BA0FF
MSILISQAVTSGAAVCLLFLVGLGVATLRRKVRYGDSPSGGRHNGPGGPGGPGGRD